jgi:hypothetical protein
MLERMAQGLYGPMHEHPNWTPAFAYDGGPASSGLAFIDETVRLTFREGLALLVVPVTGRTWLRGAMPKAPGRN